MGRSAVDQLLYLMDEAFEGNRWHSLLVNLQAVGEEDWLWTPPDGRRSIADLVVHVGGAKYMYDNHAFSDASLTWSDPLVAPPVDEERTMEDTIEWAREGHRRLRQHVAVLDDAELARPRRTNWGEMKETGWIISVMIQHDLYHAGEVNHIRALRQGNDL
jgi:uncharacterized damage-inducible protein DinB